MKSNSNVYGSALSAGLALLVGIPAQADFQVAYTTAPETMPAVALNSQSGKFLAVYGVRWNSAGDVYCHPCCQLMNPDGSKSGGELSPFGTVGTFQGLAVRPAIAYNSQDNTFFVATLESGDSSTGARVIGRFLNGDGSGRGALVFPFASYQSHYPEAEPGDGAGPIQVVYNSLLNEFVVTVQWTVWEVDPWGNPARVKVVCAKRMTESDPYSSPVVMLWNNGYGFIHRHAIAHAPVAPSGPAPYGGCYLFSGGFTSGSLPTNVVYLLDSQLNKRLDIPFRWGMPDGDAMDVDIAYGQVQGQHRFLMVYNDNNNHWPTNTTHKHTGIYGIYVDPQRPPFFPVPLPDNAFPITFIPTHLELWPPYTQAPQVSYSSAAQGFFVAWREFSANRPDNASAGAEMRTHIRGAFVDYHVSNPNHAPIPVNVVLSDVTGSCVSGNDYCPSDQDPILPDVVALNNGTATVVWQQHYPPNPSDLDIMGDLFPLVVQQAQLLNPRGVPGEFIFEFDSEVGVTHVVEFSSTLAPGSWQTLATVTGDGTRKTVADYIVGVGRRFYRLVSY